MLISMEDLGRRYDVRPAGILHLGGHIGEEAEAYQAAGAKRVVWVECHPRAFHALMAKISRFPGHEAIQVAASDRDDESVDFHEASNVCSSSLLPMHRHLEKHPDVSPCGTFKVRTVTVDTLLDRAGLKASDYEFLNMDLQGGEMLALRGMEKYLATCRWVYTEVNTEELYRGCVLMPDLTAHLAVRGFRLVEYRMWSETHGWGDALYIRP